MKVCQDRIVPRRDLTDIILRKREAIIYIVEQPCFSAGGQRSNWWLIKGVFGRSRDL
jgi:hypothetical protein